MLRIVFLDFDGVLNCSQFLANSDPNIGGVFAHEDSKINRVNVERLNTLVDRTGTRVVVSSAWRFRRSRMDLQEILTRNGFTGIVQDKTPWSKDKRGLQVREWLYGTLRRIESFVILDDVDEYSINGRVDEFKDFGRDRLVLTSPYEGGLLDKHVDAACEILERPWTR